MRLFLVFVLALVTAGVIAVAAQSPVRDELELAGDPAAVTLVGDSLNVGIEPYLRDALEETRIEAFDVVGRGTEDGVDELRRVSGTLAPVVVVSLGTNDADGTESRFRSLVTEVLELAGGDRCVVWATIVRGGVERTGFNDVLFAARESNGNLRLVDWARLVEDDATLLTSDLVHGTPEGYARRAEETARVARACPDVG